MLLAFLFKGTLCLREKVMSHPIEQLEAIMAQLRDPEGGCPWDLKQSFDTIVPHTIEETYELSDAILENDMEEVKKEIGDLMLHMVFYARIASETNTFDVADSLSRLEELRGTKHQEQGGQPISA